MRRHAADAAGRHASTVLGLAAGGRERSPVTPVSSRLRARQGKASLIDDAATRRGRSAASASRCARRRSTCAGAAIDSAARRADRQRLERFNRLDRAARRSREIVGGMLRYGPYALIGMLPVFALLMQVLYVWPRPRPAGPRERGATVATPAGRAATASTSSTARTTTRSSRWPARCALAALDRGDRSRSSPGSCAYLPLSMRRAYGGGWPGVLARELRGHRRLRVALRASRLVALVVAAVVLR